jgi:hypothetical protein
VQPNAETIEIGALYQDSSVPARLLVEELLGKHFMVVGTTGCGKSSAVTVILQRILAGYPNAHIVVLDIHNEYNTAFGSKAELINTSNLNLPFWLLNFTELATALTILLQGDGNTASGIVFGDGVRCAAGPESLDGFLAAVLKPGMRLSGTPCARKRFFSVEIRRAAGNAKRNSCLLSGKAKSLITSTRSSATGAFRWVARCGLRAFMQFNCRHPAAMESLRSSRSA